MKSRYFSIENVQKLNKEFAEHNKRNETKTKTSNLEVNGQESQVLHNNVCHPRIQHKKKFSIFSF